MSGRRLTEDELVDAGLPAGVLDLAVSLWSRAERLQGSTPMDSTESRARLLDLLTAPLRLEPDWPAPAAPLQAGDGWVHAELIDADREIFDGLALLHGHQGPEALAAACQELRLPVSPYRSLPRAAGRGRDGPTRPAASAASAEMTDPEPAGATDLSEVTVVDLSTHWSGPLITKLLADAGATVVKIDPDCRPDGFRDRPELYRHLNGNKTIVDLDLRRPSDRQRFEHLLGDADLLVESFSRRVMGNLGYAAADLAALAPGLSLLSVKAYTAGIPEQDWLAFGPGVHATSGLAMGGVCRGAGDQPSDDLPAAGRTMPRTAPVAYPDLLTGLTGFCSALELLGHRWPQGHREVSLRGTIEPLVELARRSQRTAGRPSAGAA